MMLERRRPCASETALSALRAAAMAAGRAAWLACALAATLADALAAWPATAAEVEITGQVRARELERIDYDFNRDVGASDNLALLRTTVGLSAMVGEFGSAYVELRDSRAFGEPRSTTTALERVDLHQAYIQVDNVLNKPLQLRVGRMEMSYGKQRLIGALDFDNVGRAFDGARLHYEIEDFGWFDAFADKTLEATGAGDGANATGREQALFGAYLHYKTTENGEVEVYALDLYDDLGPLDPNTAVAGDEREAHGNRFTMGARFECDLPRLSTNVYGEAAYQFGGGPERLAGPAGNKTIVDGPDLTAWAATAGANYVFGGKMEPWMGLEWNAAAGDDGKDPGKSKTFNQLFPTDHSVLGTIDFVGWQNVYALKATVGMKAGDQWRVWSSYHRLALAEPADAWYGPDGAVRLLGQAGLDDRLAQEVDLAARYTPERNLGFEASWSLWLPGKWQEQAAALAAHAGTGSATSMDLDPAQLFFVTATVSF